ncbi:MAG: hypothetical protein JWM27_2851 [Gemmatimonadetes bacterium]|nr:hypothetical protein [Gemmatimonadota bacterium]
MGNFPIMRIGLVLLGTIAVVGLGDEMLDRHHAAANGPTGAQVAAAGADEPRDDGSAALLGAVTGGIAAARDAADCSIVQRPMPLPSTVHEASGAAPSLRTPGVVWVQNDSGDPQVMAVDAGGAQLGVVRITGATVTDWEDIGVARCGAGSCLYVGDIGDNHARRPGVTVYRVPEPLPRDPASAPAEAFPATYPDGPHDAEAMFALPDGRVFIVTKGETGSAALYRFPTPMQPGVTARLQKVMEFSAEKLKHTARFTGAAASPDGRWVAIRTLRALDFYRADALVAGTPGHPLVSDLSPLGEAQGEGVGFAPEGGIFLSSEAGRGKKGVPTLSRISCRLPR